MSGKLLEQIQPFLVDLMTVFGLEREDERSYPASFGNEILVLKCRDFRLRFVRDRGDIYVDVGPVCEPSEWHLLEDVLEFVSKQNIQVKHDAGHGLHELAAALKANHVALQKFFERAKYVENKKAFEQLKKIKAEQMFGKHFRKNAE
jgi:hypothetical protein